MFVPSNLTQEEGILKSYFTTEIFVFVYFKPSIDMEVQNICYKKYNSQKEGPSILVLLKQKVNGNLLKREGIRKSVYRFSYFLLQKFYSCVKFGVFLDTSHINCQMKFFFRQIVANCPDLVPYVNIEPLQHVVALHDITMEISSSMVHLLKQLALQTIRKSEISTYLLTQTLHIAVVAICYFIIGLPFMVGLFQTSFTFSLSHKSQLRVILALCSKIS